MSVRSTYRFARLPEWILFHPELNNTDRCVFCVLDRFDGQDCFPAVATVAERLSVSEDTVRRSIRHLESVGALRVEQRFAEGGRQTSNRYVLAGDNSMVPGSNATPVPRKSATLPPRASATRSRASNDPEQEEPPLPPEDDSRAGRPSEGGGTSRINEIADAYAALCLAQCAIQNYKVKNNDLYLAKKRHLARSHKSIHEYMRRWPTAPASAVAAWLWGEKTSMAYYPDIDDSPLDES